MRSKSLALVNRILWTALLLALPITSFPAIAMLFGGSNVAPLSLLFLIPLVFTFLLPHIFKNKSLPVQSIPLLLFFLAALLSTALAWFRQTPSFQEACFLRNNVEGLLTLGTGIVFYLVAALIIDNEAELKRTLKWINIAGIIILTVSLMQALSWLFWRSYPEFLWRLQGLVSVKRTLFIRRSTGLAMEPSWLAHQLNMLFLPLWLAFTVNGQSIYRWRLAKRFTAENLFVMAGFAVLFSTLSRIGWITAGLLAAFAALPLLKQWVFAVSQRSSKHKALPQSLVWMLLIAGGIALVLAFARIAAHIDPKMRAIFNFEIIRRAGLMGWLSRLSLAERFMYWAVGYEVFLLYPILGAGLGSIGFYFPAFVPSFGFGLPEIYEVIGLNAGLTNAKNFWTRLLGETGILGFAIFISWLFQFAQDARYLYKQGGSSFGKTMGLFGGLTLLAFLLEGFSLDTFGLPYYWISFGLSTVAWRCFAADQADQMQKA